MKCSFLLSISCQGYFKFHNLTAIQYSIHVHTVLGVERNSRIIFPIAQKFKAFRNGVIKVILDIWHFYFEIDW